MAHRVSRFHRIGVRARPPAIGAIALCLLFPRPAAAQAPDSVSLQDALRLAVARNPDLVSARVAVDSARAQERVAGEVPNPTFLATVDKIPVDGTSSSTRFGNSFFDRSYDTTIALAQLLEIPGKRSGRRTSASEALRQAEAKLSDSERGTLASVRKGYAATAVARETARIASETAESFRRTAALATERETAGEISASDRAQVEIAAGRSAADAATAESGRLAAFRSLEAVLGLEPSPARAFPDSFDALLTGLEAPEAGDDEEALSRRPDVAALDAAVRRAEADVRLQKKLRLPDPTLLLQYERLPPDQRNTVGVGFTLPLPIWNRNGGAIAAADAALEGARRDFEAGLRRARLELAATRDALRAARTRAERYGSELSPRAEKVRATVEFAYEQGAASLLELLEAERSSNDIRLAAAAAQGDLVAAAVDYAAARARLVFTEERP